jgi:predicted DCC family thiol-disulfide oxidoreductase YuxK
MNQYISDSLAKELCHSGFRVAKNSLPLFYKVDSEESGDFQTPIAMLSICIELLMKSLVAKKSAHLIFENLPKDIQDAFTNQTMVSMVGRKRLENFDFDTINFDRTVSFVKSNYDLRSLKNLFKIVRPIRNKSVHGVLTSLEKFYLYRVYYLVVKLCDMCIDEGCTDIKIIGETERDFIKKIDNEKINQLKVRVEAAKKKAESINYFTITLGEEETNWNTFKGECSVCRNEGKFIGETELVGNKVKTLIFKPNEFECPECKLQLLDEIELDYMHYSKELRRDEDLREYMIKFGRNSVGEE